MQGGGYKVQKWSLYRVQKGPSIHWSKISLFFKESRYKVHWSKEAVPYNRPPCTLTRGVSLLQFFNKALSTHFSPTS